MNQADNFIGTIGHYSRFADTWMPMSTQAQAKTLRMVKGALLVRLAPTKAPHLHVRMTGYSTSQEGEDALLAAEEADVPDVGVVRSVALPSARALLAAASRGARGSDCDSESGTQSLTEDLRESSTERDSSPSSCLDEAATQLLCSSHAVAGSAADEESEESEEDEGGEEDEEGGEDDQGEEDLGDCPNFRPVVGEKRKRDPKSEGKDPRQARRRRVDDSEVD